jgi:ClpP class serine protease
LHALREIYLQALARGSITDEVLNAVMRENAELGEALHMTSLDALAVRTGTRMENTRYVTMFGQVAVIDIIGPIYPRANMMTASGATSAQQLAADFVRAYNSDDVAGLLFNVDSPGGDVRGISETAGIIRSLVRKGRKPVKTYAAGYMASAAYFLGSTAQEIVANDSAILGSIGVVLTAKKNTDGTYEIVSSVSPNKRPDPSTEQGQAVLKEQVDDLADVFVAAVAAHRGITAEQVVERYGKGGVMVGVRAKKAGLADRIGTFAQVLDELTREAEQKSSRRGNRAEGQDSLVAALLTEDDPMKLSELVAKFRASNQTLEEGADKKTEGQEEGEAAADKTAGAAADDGGKAAADLTDEGQEGGAKADAKPTREELEERFADPAERFALQLVVDSRILPAMQEHAATDLMNAMIDDFLYGGTVRFPNAEGQIISGTREEKERAKYAAMPRHTMAEKGITALKEGQVEGKVLAEGEDETVTTQEIGRDRIEQLLASSDAGRAVLDARAREARKQQQ